MEQVVKLGFFEGPWGPIWLASTSSGICWISLREGRGAIERGLTCRIPGCTLREDPGAFGEAIRQMEEYFRGERHHFSLAMAPMGTEFQLRVWKALQEVPYGQTQSYREIAVRVGRPQAARAVGQAVGKNPLPILIPCHRVIQSNGGMGGFTGGLDLKSDLLALEARGK